MPIPSARFENNEKAARAVSRHLDSLRPSPQRFCLRPYNRFDPAFTTWWLVPSNDWPAYAHGKLFLQSDDSTGDDARLIAAGYYIEKGVGRELDTISGIPSTQLLNDRWYWHDFIKASEAGDAESAVVEVGRRSGRPVVIHAAAWPFNSVPQLDQEVPPHEDSLQIVVEPASGVVQAAEVQGRLFKPLAGSQSLRDLASGFAGIEKLDFFWVDLTISIRLRYGSPAMGEWGATEIWRNALEPWNRWVH